MKTVPVYLKVRASQWLVAGAIALFQGVAVQADGPVIDCPLRDAPY